MPSLQVLAERSDVDTVRVISFEKQDPEPYEFPWQNVSHFPIPRTPPGSVLAHSFRFLKVLRQMRSAIKKGNTDLIICRGVMAGAYGYLLHRSTGIPFVVESFEPHADYMADSNTWVKGGVKYRFQKWMEKRQMEKAQALVTVAENYANVLRQNKVKSSVYCAPCPVDLDRFGYAEDDRNRLRKELGFSDNDVVGVYIGKFGDIYYTPEEAWVLLGRVKQLQPSFKIMVLTDRDRMELLRLAMSKGFEEGEVTVKLVDHSEVSAYLSAADVALCLVRPSKHRPYCCPIKNAEYWAVGLPVIIPEGVGDDSEIIRSTGLGLVLEDMQGSNLTAERLRDLAALRTSDEIFQLASQYRGIGRTKEVYNELLNL